MQSFLIALVECSVSMSVLIFCLIALTPGLSKKYEAKWIYFAWLVPVAGLIVPYRLHPSAPLISIDTSFYTTPTIQSGAMDSSALQTVNQGTMPVSWQQAVFFLWIAGTILFLVYHAFRHVRFIRMVRRWGEPVQEPWIIEALQKGKEDVGLKKQISLQVCSCISSPMMIGFLHPVILLPKSDFAVDEFELILKHELIHCKRKDLWYKGLVLLATAMHWFNPAVYFMVKAIAVQCEISCDAEVVKDMNLEVRQRYSEAIIGVIKNQSQMRTAFSTNLYGGKKGMKNRIFSIMDITKKRAGAFVLCLAIIGTVGTGAAFAATSKGNNGHAAAPVAAQQKAPQPQATSESISVSEGNAKLSNNIESPKEAAPVQKALAAVPQAVPQQSGSYGISSSDGPQQAKKTDQKGTGAVAKSEPATQEKQIVQVTK